MDDMASVGLQVDSREVRTASGDLDRFAGAGDRAGGSAGRAQGAFSGMGKGLAVAAASALAAVVSIAALISQIKRFIDATVTNEKAQAQLGAAIASTGGAAGRSLSQLNAHAAALQKITNFGDEATNAMQGILLTFTNIKGDQFDAATVSTINLATAMGTDLKSAALQVGKALNDPVLGMTALARSGIQFTEAQKEMVKGMVEANDTIGAQTIILAELERQFGGSAEAARDTLGGALRSLGNAWGDLFELSGPAAEGLKKAIEGLVTAVQNPGFVSAIKGIGTLLFNMATGAVWAINGLIAVFGVLRTVIDIPGRLFNWVFNLGETSLQAQRATDLLTLAMADEIRQIAVLSDNMSGGITMSRRMAEAKLQQAEAHYAALEAARLESLRLITIRDDYVSLETTIEQMGRTLDGIINEQRNFAPMFDRGEIDDFLVQMQRVKDEQLELLGDAGKLSAEYIAAEENIERVRADIEAATGDQVTFNGAAITLEDILRRNAAAAGGISFASAISDAATLARTLGISLNSARLLAGLGLGDAAIAAGDGRGSQRAAVQSATQANTDRILAQQADIREGFIDSTRAAWGLADAVGGGVSGAASSAADEISRVTANIIESGAASIAAAEQAKEYSNTMTGFVTDGIGKAVDWMVNGFKGGLSSIKDMFVDTIKQMIAFAIKNRIMLSLGMGGSVAGGAASAGGIGGAISAAGGLGPAITAAGGIGKLASSFAGGVGSFMTGGFGAIGPALEGASAGLGGLAAAAGAVALPLIAVAAIFTLLNRNAKRRKEAAAAEAAAEKARDAAAQAAAQAAAARAEALAQIMKAIADERYGLETRLLTVQGNTAALRARELAVLAPSNRALQQTIWRLEDMQVAAQAAAEAQRQLAEQQRLIADQRYGLETRLLTVQGNTAALRQRELAALFPTNRALQRMIWGLEEARGAAEALAEAQAAAAAKVKAITDERLGLETKLLTLQGNTAELRQRELAALDPTNRALQRMIWGLEDAAKAMEALNPNRFASLFDFQIAQSRNVNGFAPANISTPPMFTPSFTSPVATDGATVVELRTLNQRMQRMEDEQRQYHLTDMRNGKKTSDTLERWEAIGLPRERTS